MEYKKTFCFDVDGVIMGLVPGNDYHKSEPIYENVNVINQLYDAGHYIILYTARGFVTKIDWKQKTIDQLKRAGLKYHELYFGKPAADFYIDDRMTTFDDIIKQFIDK